MTWRLWCFFEPCFFSIHNTDEFISLTNNFRFQMRKRGIKIISSEQVRLCPYAHSFCSSSSLISSTSQRGDLKNLFLRLIIKIKFNIFKMPKDLKNILKIDFDVLFVNVYILNCNISWDFWSRNFHPYSNKSDCFLLQFYG